MKARHYTYACMESGGASWRGDGWLEAGCLPQRQAEIHNLWRKILRLLCLSKSCKSLHLGFLLALGSLSLLQITHGDIFRVEKRKKSSKWGMFLWPTSGICTQSEMGTWPHRVYVQSAVGADIKDALSAPLLLISELQFVIHPHRSRL